MVRVNNILGVIFSELGEAELGAAVERIESKTLLLFTALNAKQVEAFKFSFYSYPRSWKGGGYALLDPILYPDLV